MCIGSEFQIDGTETENAQEVKLLVMPEGTMFLVMTGDWGDNQKMH